MVRCLMSSYTKTDASGKELGLFRSTKSFQVMGGWRKQRDEELHNLHYSLNVFRKVK
jgi:hypothetical protein